MMSRTILNTIHAGMARQMRTWDANAVKRATEPPNRAVTFSDEKKGGSYKTLCDMESWGLVENYTEHNEHYNIHMTVWRLTELGLRWYERIKDLSAEHRQITIKRNKLQFLTEIPYAERQEMAKTFDEQLKAMDRKVMEEYENAVHEK